MVEIHQLSYYVNDNNCVLYSAMKTSGNKYILNGPQELSSEGEYFVAGTKFTYHKNHESWCPGQCLFAKGPTTEPIEIQVQSLIKDGKQSELESFQNY